MFIHIIHYNILLGHTHAPTWYILIHLELFKCFVSTIGGAVSGNKAWCTRTGRVQETLHTVIKLITQGGLYVKMTLYVN